MSWDDIPDGQGVIDLDRTNSNPEDTNIIIHGKTLKKSEVKSFSFEITNLNNDTDLFRQIPARQEITFTIETTFGGRITGSMTPRSSQNFDPRKVLGMPTTEQILENNGLAPFKRSTKENLTDLQKHSESYKNIGIFPTGISDTIRKVGSFGGFGSHIDIDTNIFSPNFGHRHETNNNKSKIKKHKVKQFDITIGKRDEQGNYDYRSETKIFDPQILKKVARVPKSKQKKIKEPKPNKKLTKKQQKEIEKENKYKQPPIVY